MTRSMNFNPDRLIKILSMDMNSWQEYPMISLPDNNTYWSDGWNTLENSYISSNSTTNQAFIYPKIYSMLSKSTQDLRKKQTFINSNSIDIGNYELNNNNNDDELFSNNEFVTLANDENVLRSIENIKNELILNSNTIMDKVKKNRFLALDCHLILKINFIYSINKKDHLDFYGQDTNNFPIILSYKIVKLSNSDYIKAILRYSSFS